MIRLKGVNAKVVWGGRALETLSQNIVTLSDNEFITLAGSNLLLFENSSVYSRKASILDSHLVDVMQIDHICMSKDSKYLGLVVKLKNNERNVINIYIFHTSNHMQDFLKPRHIKYTTKQNLRTYETLQANCIAFSSNSTYLVCGINHLSCGIVIFEQFKGTIYQTIATDSIPISISFHPIDETKIVVTGEDSLIKFWRFTAKSFHAAAVNGLKKGSHTYCCHEWIQPYSENVLVVGSTTGFLSVIQNCDQRVPAISMFGESEDLSTSSAPSYPVTQLLVRGDHVIASSRSNMIVLFELRRVMVAKSFVGLSVVLVPLVHYRVEGVEAVRGLQFCFRESVTSYAMVATTTDSILALDFIQDSDLSEDLLGDDEKKIEWRDVTVNKPLTSFHSKTIQSVSLSSCGKVLMTSSYQDQTVRFWNYDSNSIFNSSWLIESYKDRPIDDTPFYVDLHPSGLHVVCAYETEVKEFAICDNQLDLMRRFGVKSAFQNASGIPIVISQPVSIVKYSNGGHLLAVVTGKICQLFHMFKYDENSSNQDAPCRIMAMCDHVSPISDLVFLQDDTQIITTSTDGSVYSWDVGASSRNREYVQKGVSATHVAVSNKQYQENMIIVSFESNATHDPSTFVNDTVRRRRASSVAVRRISTALNFGSSDSYHESPFSAGIRSSMTRTPDIAFAANAIAQAFEGGKFGMEGTNPHAAPYSNRQTAATTGVARLSFLAIFTKQLSNNPTIVALETPVRSIAMGRTGQPDAFDFCALGLADGRIIISALPIPLLDISFANIRTYSITSSNSSTISSPLGATRPNTVTTQSQKATSKSRRVGITLPENSVLDSMSDVLLSNNADKEAQETTTIVSDEAEEEFNVNTLEHKTAPQQKINESMCKVMRLTVGSITNVRVSADGERIIATGEDGSVTILHTSKNRAFVTESESPEVKESDSGAVSTTMKSNQFLMIEKQKMFYLRQKVVDLDSTILQSKKEYEFMLNKMLESKDNFIADLESKFKSEIHKRDESILSSRNEYLLMKRNMQEEIERLKKEAQESLLSMELGYEKKLAHESTYLEKMKQAYDEYVVHARMDMLQLQQHTESKIKDVEDEKLKLIQEIEKEKSAVLKYYDYIQDRNSEVLQSLEEQQTNERLRLKAELQQTTAKLQQAQQQNMSSEVQASRKIQRLKVDIETREMEILRVNSDIDWANDRISKLETSLMQSTNELKARSELLDKNEVKIGELQQKIDDMERVRKTLTVQVHNLQSSLQPKEKELMKMTEKLQELTREYEISLQAITEKEAALQQKNDNMLLLQKQVRELRSVSAQKESALRRAATFFEEFIYAMHEARFEAKKKVPLALQQHSQKLKGVLPGGNSGVGGGNMLDASGDNDNKDDSNAGGGGGTGTANNAAASKKRDLTATSTSKGRELIAGLNLEFQADAKLKSLQDILKPYLVDVKVEAEILDDIEAVKQEQDRHLQLLHRNFQTLQNSMETANQAASNKVFNHLMDNQTLIKEVNNLRAEVRALSLENHRLSAQLSFQNSQSRRNTTTLSAIPSFESSTQSQFAPNEKPAVSAATSSSSLMQLQQEEIPLQAQMTFPSRAQKVSSAPASTGKASVSTNKKNATLSSIQQKSDHANTKGGESRSNIHTVPSISSLLASVNANNNSLPNHGVFGLPSSDSLPSEHVSSANSKSKSDGKRAALKLATSQILLSSSSTTSLSK